MRSFAVVSALLAASASAQATGALGDAARIMTNPIGASYVATLPNSEKNSVRGSVTATSSPNGEGVYFQVTFNGLPAEGGPFAYHIHSTPVPADGNCTGTLAHLDPYERGQPPKAPKCDAANPQTCEVGDLAGKHGAIESTTYNNAFTDFYASLQPGIGAFFGNRSIVIHYANSTRITCANFTEVAVGAPVPSSGTSLPAPSASAPYGYNNGTIAVLPTGALPTGAVSTSVVTSTPTGSSPPVQSDNAASAAGFGAGALFAAVAAFAL